MAQAAIHADLGLMNLAWRRLTLRDLSISTTVASGGVMMEGEGGYAEQGCEALDTLSASHIQLT